jgi:hypothetical protein
MMNKNVDVYVEYKTCISCYWTNKQTNSSSGGVGVNKKKTIFTDQSRLAMAFLT